MSVIQKYSEGKAWEKKILGTKGKKTSRMYRTVCSVFMVAICLLIVSAGTSSAQHRARLGDLVPTDTIVMGIVPAEDPSIALERQKPLTDYLSERLGRPIRVFFATDYTGVVEAMRAGQIHMAWFGPFSYVLAAERANAVPVAVAMHDDGSVSYHSYFISSPEVARVLNITEPLEGKEGIQELFRRLEPHKRQFSFTFTDPASTSGFAVPRFNIHQGTNGGEPEDWFSRVGFSGSHDAGQMMIRQGTIDIAAVWDKRYHEMISAGTISPETNVKIFRSSPIPESPIAFRRDLDPEIIKKIQQAFADMPQEIARTQGETYKGYQIVTEEDYQIIVEIKELLDRL